MSDRLEEIRARLDAATPGPWADDHKSWCVWAPNHDLNEREDRCLVAEVGCGPDTDLIAHAPADIAWLLRQLENERADNALHEEDIFDLRDQVNAAMDTIHHLAGNGQQYEWAMDYYAQRVKKQRQTRRPHSA